MNLNIKILFILLIYILPHNATADMLDWHLVKEPTNKNPRIYGTYFAGCMDGGIRLPKKGIGFFLGGVHDNRAYGQPELINYIKTVSKIVSDTTNQTLIIGDLSSPRGGPAPIWSSLHQSHQSGLDVDIWFRAAKKSENPSKIKQVLMLNSNRDAVNRQYWSEDNVRILKKAASFDEVDRIFVNPVIKRELCSQHAGEPWIGKIRGWWGHAEHFHVRLKCPENSPDCKMQQPLKEGDGCGEELDWWFSEDAKSGGKKEPRKYPDLPKECDVVFKE